MYIHARKVYFLSVICIGEPGAEVYYFWVSGLAIVSIPLCYWPLHILAYHVASIRLGCIEVGSSIFLDEHSICLEVADLCT